MSRSVLRTLPIYKSTNLAKTNILLENKFKTRLNKIIIIINIKNGNMFYAITFYTWTSYFF